jgi:hypothetical protein
MKRKCLVAGALSLVTAIAFAAGSLVIPVDNFNDGDSDGWLENDFTGDQVASFDASSGSYVLSTTAPVPITDPGAGAIDADWEPSEDRRIFANGTFRGTIRADTYGTTIGFLFRENHETETDYGFYGSTSFGTFYIERFDLFDPDGPQTIIAMADPEEFPFEVGKTYVLEATVVGHKLELKAWELGCKPPRHPILRVHDKTLGPEDGTGLGAIAFLDPVPLAQQGITHVTLNATVDDLKFIPAKKNKR